MAYASVKTLAGSCIAMALAACGDSLHADASQNETGALRIVGSSTVFPFSTKVAQEYRNTTGQAVVVEATGSGGGHKIFCEGLDSHAPDIVNSSRRQKRSEYDLCQANGVETILELKIGYDGIVLANALDSAAIDMSLATLYLGLAERIPVSGEDCRLVPNPYSNWREIDARLPDFEIEVYGPPPTSGTRDAFVEIAMEGGARAFPCLTDLSEADFRRTAHRLREDGHWIDSGENDNALVQTLVNTSSAIGVFGYSFLDQNVDKVKGAQINGVAPNFGNITSGRYPVARSLYVYVKGDNLDRQAGLEGYALELLSETAAGPGGYLQAIGLIPLPAAERAALREDVRKRIGYTP